ncbi:hypothetical protein PHYPSEUDO_002356 [Phytophthora pseudosyringae]|uniref:Uncharacterized protein n=1 Tax=Phytophthora pseudosyringae TaxID=221518 RepID=A0A8T1VU24_9STRA|nr:hypothetical protein PHYPSEUDO_002356 [Phytophthora pseudosyringae]
MRYNDEIAGKIEEMLLSSSLDARVWAMNEQHPPANLRDRIRAFMYLDDESSFELRRQLQGEINEALSDVVPSASASDSIVPAPSIDTSDSDIGEADPEKPDLQSQIRGVLLGITEVASRLRLLPRTGADTAKMAPLQLEGCIAAADQIRHCVQAFDNNLHGESRRDEQTQSTKKAARKPGTDRALGGDTTLV